MRAILEAIRAGHVFIDVQGRPGRAFDFVASQGGREAEMGDTLAAPRGAAVQVTMHAKGLDGAHAQIIVDGKEYVPTGDLSIHSAEQALSFEWPSDGGRHWMRANVRAADGALLIVGNPVYLNE